MGNVVHRVLVVTTYDRKQMELLKEYAPKSSEGPYLSPVNGYWTLFVPPCGSKLGWEGAEARTREIESFKKWLYAQRDDDEGSPLEWFEAEYGSDLVGLGCVGARVTEHEWSDRRLVDEPPGVERVRDIATGGELGEWAPLTVGDAREVREYIEYLEGRLQEKSKQIFDQRMLLRRVEHIQENLKSAGNAGFAAALQLALTADPETWNESVLFAEKEAGKR